MPVTAGGGGITARKTKAKMKQAMKGPNTNNVTAAISKVGVANKVRTASTLPKSTRTKQAKMAKQYKKSTRKIAAKRGQSVAAVKAHRRRG